MGGCGGQLIFFSGPLFPLTSSPSAGSFPDAQLPSKRIIGPKNYEFLTSKREEFQEYLQVELLGTFSNVAHLFGQGDCFHKIANC